LEQHHKIGGKEKKNNCYKHIESMDTKFMKEIKQVRKSRFWLLKKNGV
jgi:hypothetical protein